MMCSTARAVRPLQLEEMHQDRNCGQEAPCSGAAGAVPTNVLDGANATVPNARWRKVICDSQENTA